MGLVIKCTLKQLQRQRVRLTGCAVQQEAATLERFCSARLSLPLHPTFLP